MYKLWCIKNNIKLKIININKINKKKYKSILFRIKKKNILKYFFLEKGIHKIIRLFNNKRQTSLIKVDIINYNNNKIIIEEKKIIYQTIKSKGKGGQNINKVETGIRLKYKNINIKFTKFNSQIINKKYAKKLLYKKIILNNNNIINYKKVKKYNNIKNKNKIIRSYIFYPYNLIKDYKSNINSSNITKILNGNLKKFINYKINKLQI
ncbi:MAG: peptide chain release factor-like protein [Candidatus Shikimatogenerans sp. Tduv]|uniref:Peptide chain release factor-like protein n=1 Tax=Candidatus Shikimatogenerans sp. Tduv TaxID=3158567 RepID=A0AAU7QTV1_9FLAO